MTTIHAVILAGGRGERFWPKSRAALPKQMLALTGGRTMLEETLDRVAPLAPASRQWVITSADLVDPIKKAGITGPMIVGEPAGRNTAPAIAVAAAEITRKDPEAVMVILPSDHHIRDVGRFRQALQQAAELAGQDYLVTIGIRPDRPETGYGYIEAGEPLDGCAIPCHRAQGFREKPDAATAESFLAAGTYFWNAGIFIWRASAILRELQRHMPALYKDLTNWQSVGGLSAGKTVFAHFYQDLPKISIDYGVLEKAERIAVVTGDFGWDDLGSWESLERYHKKDSASNVTDGQAVALDSRRNIIIADQGLVACLGVDDLIVVRDRDAVLVCHRSRAQEIRKVLEELRKREGGDKYL